MLSIELYRQDRPTVLVQRSGDTNPGAWAMIQEALARGVVSGSTNQTVVHADIFLAELDVLRELRAIYAESLDLGPTLTAHLKSMAADDELARPRSVAASNCRIWTISTTNCGPPVSSAPSSPSRERTWRRFSVCPTQRTSRCLAPGRRRWRWRPSRFSAVAEWSTG